MKNLLTRPSLQIATIVLLLFAVTGLSTLAKNSQYFSNSNPAHYLNISNKMKGCSTTTMRSGESGRRGDFASLALDWSHGFDSASLSPAIAILTVFRFQIILSLTIWFTGPWLSSSFIRSSPKQGCREFGAFAARAGCPLP
jgi:hypothetical protein